MVGTHKKPNRRERRATEAEAPDLRPKEVRPLTVNQDRIFKSYYSQHNLLLHGIAGSGKTFLAVYLGLVDVMIRQKYHKLVIIRSSVQARNIGHLPGGIRQKTEIFEQPYAQICGQLFDGQDVYRTLKSTGLILFETTSFLRGLTIDDAVIVVDEIQNLTDQEIHTIMTRIGRNSRIILCGDHSQNDLENISRFQTSGFKNMYAIVRQMPSFRCIELTVQDCLRSGVVKEWLTARESVLGGKE